MGLKVRKKTVLTGTAKVRLEELRWRCLAFDGATEKIAWGDPTWRIANRIFAMRKGNVQGGRSSVWFKGENGAQSMLIEANPDAYFVPPYVGHKGWIGAYLDTDSLDFSELEYLIGISYRLVARR